MTLLITNPKTVKAPRACSFDRYLKACEYKRQSLRAGVTILTDRDADRMEVQMHAFKEKYRTATGKNCRSLLCALHGSQLLTSVGAL